MGVKGFSGLDRLMGFGGFHHWFARWMCVGGWNKSGFGFDWG